MRTGSGTGQRTHSYGRQPTYTASASSAEHRCGPSLIPLVLLLAALSLTGCTSWSEYVHNRFLVGPNYSRPAVPVADAWIDAADQRLRSDSADDSQWWTSFNDPVLSELVQSAYAQNLSVREAGFRVLQARAQLGIAVGELFPQMQTNVGEFSANAASLNVANRQFTPERWFNQWNYGFNLAWELDFWGRLRRAIESSEATLDASIEQYDDVLVTLLGDVASTYVAYRTTQQRIAYAEENVRVQQEILTLATARYQGGQTSQLDVNQSQSDLSNTQSLIPRLRISLRQANNRLCILLGMPPEDLHQRLGTGPIPTVPADVAVGIPAELLRRRPDVRRAERQVAAQSAQIGIAQSDLYPQITINGAVGWSSQDLHSLLAGNSFNGTVGPAFRWNILNYGRIVNNVKVQDARFQELAVTYQQTLLQANQEVEDGLVRFLESQEEAHALNASVAAAEKSVEEAVAQYQGGLTDFNRVAVLQERLVQRQEQLAQAQGEVAQGLIAVYRALGGGWQLRTANG